MEKIKNLDLREDKTVRALFSIYILFLEKRYIQYRHSIVQWSKRHGILNKTNNLEVDHRKFIVHYRPDFLNVIMLSILNYRQNNNL